MSYGFRQYHFAPTFPTQFKRKQVHFLLPAALEVEQIAFRVYNAGTLAGSTARQAENVNDTVDDHLVFQLRVALQEVGGVSDAAENWELWGQKNGAGGYSQKTDLTDVRVWLSPTWADDATTGDRLSTPLGSNQAGRADEIDGSMAAITLLANGNVELVWNLIIKRDAGITTDFWDFEVRRGDGSQIDTYTRRPRITLNRIAAQPGHIKSIDTGTAVNDRDCFATQAFDVSLDINGVDMEVLWDAFCPQWNPDSPDATNAENMVIDRSSGVGDNRSFHVQFPNAEFSTPEEMTTRVSDSGFWDVTHTHQGTNFVEFRDNQRWQGRYLFDGDDGVDTEGSGEDRSGPFVAADLDDGVGWTSRDPHSTTALSGNIHQSTEGVTFWARHQFVAGGMPDQSQMYRVVLFEGLAQSRRICDFKTYDGAYRTPEDKLASTYKNWVNQGEVPAPIIWNGVEDTVFQWIADAPPVTDFPVAPRRVEPLIYTRM